jgi:sulfur relay (sulfurtransferase) DsrC/TusE family protein
MAKEKKIVLSEKQKDVIRLMREGYFLYENRVTPGARWSLSKYKNSYNWGSVNGNVIAKINHLIEGRREHTACFVYELTERGKNIKL